MPETMQNLYSDLLIRIHARENQDAFYAVEAWTGDGGHYTGGELRLDRAALQAAEGDSERYGLQLFYALFGGPIRQAYDRAVGHAEAQNGGRLRLRLWIAEPAVELHALAWERLHHLWQGVAVPFAVRAETPFSRYTSLELGTSPALSERPVRILFVIANPADLGRYNLPSLNIAQELASLTKALTNLQRVGQIELTILAGRTGVPAALREDLLDAGYVIEDVACSLANLMRLLTQAKPYHVLHFLGHGRFSRRSASSALFLEGASGNAHIVRAADFVAQLRVLDALPHLVFLAACQSATRDPEGANAFVGLAPQVVAAGVPAVVAMQDFVPLRAAQSLSRNFYHYLLEHGIVDRALNQARLLLYNDDASSWSVPALFMRLDAGQLFVADPVRAVLSEMAQGDIFNPLEAGGAYLPLEAQHLSKPFDAFSLDQLAQDHVPSRSVIEALWDVLAPSKVEIAPHGPSCVVVIGSAGMGKSIKFRQIGQATLQQSMSAEAARVVVPVFVDLAQLSREPSIASQNIETLILDALALYWGDDIGEPSPETLLGASSGPILRILVDGSDVFPDNVRRAAWQSLTRFIYRHPRHEYLVACNVAQFDPLLLPVTDVLVLQPLSRRGIECYLTEILGCPEGGELYAAIKESQLFDLAAMPWLLFKMLKQTAQGKTPDSHAQVLKILLEDAIASIAGDQGMRARAASSLYALAWRMQSTFSTTLTIDEAFEIMAEVRRNRGYSLEQLYQELVKHELLIPVGEESLRFTRSNIRAYCCAKFIVARDDCESVVDEIAATLGRHTRYRWWEETLILLSSLLDDAALLIRLLLYGVALSEGEQVFLAARCIQECHKKTVDPQLINYVVSILLWRLDSIREPRAVRRERSADLLGQLQHPAAVPQLVKVAYEKALLTPLRDLDYEHSNVRLAAVRALQSIVKEPYLEIESIAPRFSRLLNYWAAGEVEALIPYLIAQGEQITGGQAIAAFALGDLKTQRATDVVVQLFLSPGFSDVTRQALTIALTLLDPAVVTQRAILPLLDEEFGGAQKVPSLTRESAARWYPYLVYLIGKTRTQHPSAQAFLHRCLNEIPDIALKAVAILSLGWLHHRPSKTRFEDIALEDFSSLQLAALPSPDEKQLLQLNALGSLSYIGDVETLMRLQKRQAGWSPELEQAFYWTIEEILSRQNRG